MPDNIQGNQANSTNPLTATITSMANASGSTTCTTSAPHYFGNGDQVYISTNVTSGLGTCTVVDATHFTTTTPFVSTGTGTATDLSLTPAFEVPTDGDTGSLSLSGMLSTLQCLADRTQKLAANPALLGTGQKVQTFTANGNWQCPASTYWAIIVACGGGGGGAGGVAGTTGTAAQAPGGGGGAGAPLVAQVVPVVPGTVYPVTVGNGGGGGAGGSSSVAPSNGGNGLSSLACGLTFPGGMGGRANLQAAPYGSPTLLSASLGGIGVPIVNVQPNSGAGSAGPWPIASGSGTAIPVFPYDAAQGGHSFARADGNPSAAWNGGESLTGQQGGQAGGAGANVSSYDGGAGGGGGGGGALGLGATGGAGGSGSAGTGSVGSVGSSGAANTGAGGGGGGAGGAGSMNGGNGGNGGAGGTGSVQIFWIQGFA